MSQSFAPPLVYKQTQGIEDSVFQANGEVKPHWSYLLNSLETMGASSFSTRNEKALRILRDDGASYNVYGNNSIASSTWNLDLVPSVISSESWRNIEAGIAERAEVLNYLLRDIYGPRELIRTGVIPPKALFSHRGFLRACQGIKVPGNQDLIMLGIDLMLDANGAPTILTDRTQSPSGMGYSLENRTVMSRVMPSLFRDSHVHRLASFFQRLRAKLNSISPNQDDPRIVILTPGSNNETYFEHAYLANYMGFHLVQNGDLIVRDGFVWMKSLDGLSRVDVILRRVDDWYCDPVELRGDSQLGIANLLEAARSGNVVIANPLGSGILENHVFLKYLPKIAKTILGRDLRIPTVPNYWCGDKEDMTFVRAHVDELVIKPIDRSTNVKSVYGGSLTNQQKKDLLEKIQSSPDQYVAQPIMSPSQLPTHTPQGLAPRPAILRSFAIADDNSSYTVMPGGLTRVGEQQDSFLISNQAGSYSKDTWVLASEPELTKTNIKTDEQNTARNIDLISLPSRVVENLFWMGRYAERAEASLRLLRTVFVMLNGEEPISDVCMPLILNAITEVTGTQPGFINASAELISAPEQELLIIVKDASRNGSVAANLTAMLNCADQSKELLSTDTLRVINDVRDGLVELDSTLVGDLAAAPEEALDPLVTALMALAGLAQESMIHDIGWRFMEIGRRLERGLQTTVIINRLMVQEVPETDQNILLQTVLQSTEALISYRRRYRARMGVQSSLDLIMLDTDNPRSLLFQLESLNQHIQQLPKPHDNKHELLPEERASLECETLIKLSLLTELSSRENGQRVLLAKNLSRVTELLWSISTLISDKYFNHRESSRQLVSSIGEQA
jgi:uncharacterized circularly permuted ATP-grasp superfamily protein/uncharacterized alpha-E superfamily protein